MDSLDKYFDAARQDTVEVPDALLTRIEASAISLLPQKSRWEWRGFPIKWAGFGLSGAMAAMVAALMMMPATLQEEDVAFFVAFEQEAAVLELMEAVLGEADNG